MGAIVLLFLILVFLAVFIGSLVSVLNKKVPNDERLIWILLIIFMPIIGSFIYLLIGRPRLIAYQIKHSNRHYFKY